MRRISPRRKPVIRLKLMYALAISTPRKQDLTETSSLISQFATNLSRGCELFSRTLTGSWRQGVVQLYSAEPYFDQSVVELNLIELINDIAKNYISIPQYQAIFPNNRAIYRKVEQAYFPVENFEAGVRLNRLLLEELAK